MAAVGRLTRSEALREALADQIISGGLAPGTKLDESSLAARFGVSRTPVREALKHLAATGLIRMQPHRAAEVASVTGDRMSEMFEARAELEGLCARFCALRMTPAERRRLEQLHHDCADRMRSGNIEAYHAANAAFHNAIYTGSHNAALAEIAGGLRRRLSPFTRAQFRGTGRLGESYAEHDAAVQAILRGQADVAQEAMRRHVAVVRQALDEYTSRLPPRVLVRDDAEPSPRAAQRVSSR